MDVLDALERLGTGGASWGDELLDPACMAGELPETKEIDAFRPLFHRDLMLLTGFSEVLPRLFASSSMESSEKRLDGGLGAASKLLRLSLRPSEAREDRCSDDGSGVKNLALSCGSGSGTSKDVEG